MATPFSTALVKLRAASGYGSPHAFFAKNGGRKVLGFTYVTYWKMEKGEILPKAERLSVMMAALKLSPERPEAEDLARVYLKTLLGSEIAYAWIARVLAGPRKERNVSAGDKAIKRVLEEEVVHLDHAQNMAVIKDYGTYWAFNFLTNTRDAWKPEDLAQKFHIPKKEMLISLKTLASCRIVKFQPDGSVSCPLAGKPIRYLPKGILSRADIKRLKGYKDRAIKLEGVEIKWTMAIPRARAEEFQYYLPKLDEALHNAHLYAEPGHSAAPSDNLYLVEGTVYNLMDFHRPSKGRRTQRRYRPSPLGSRGRSTAFSAGSR